MKHLVRVVLTGTFAWVLLTLLPYSISPAHANPVVPEIILNSSTVQVIHNTGTNKDVLNMSLNVTNDGDPGCDGEADDLLESGVTVAVFNDNCAGYTNGCILSGTCPPFTFVYTVNPFVEHDIGNTSYGTFFALNGGGTVSSKITQSEQFVDFWLYDTACGTWNITFQATGLNLSAVTSSPIALFLNDSDNDGNGGSGPMCFDVTPQIGNGIVKPHQGLHRLRHASR